MPVTTEVLRRARRGDERAFAEVVDAYGGFVLNLAFRMSRDRQEAEDLAQEVFLRVFRAFDRFDPERPFAPWLRRVATNLLINLTSAKKHRMRRQTASLDSFKDAAGELPADRDAPEASAGAIRSERAETLNRAILKLQPDGIFLSNGPGDPAATGDYSVPAIQDLLKTDIPIFGICLGHQMLALALGAITVKMHQGHHGANHPVKDHTTGKVEIVSMNHGFAVDQTSLPQGVEETHKSLFDGSNCGLRVAGKSVFSVQHHPEASPGPQDSHYLFVRFVNLMREKKGKEPLPERG